MCHSAKKRRGDEPSKCEHKLLFVHFTWFWHHHAYLCYSFSPYSSSLTIHTSFLFPLIVIAHISLSLLTLSCRTHFMGDITLLLLSMRFGHSHHSSSEKTWQSSVIFYLSFFLTMIRFDILLSRRFHFFLISQETSRSVSSLVCSSKIIQFDFKYLRWRKCSSETNSSFIPSSESVKKRGIDGWQCHVPEREVTRVKASLLSETFFFTKPSRKEIIVYFVVTWQQRTREEKRMRMNDACLVAFHRLHFSLTSLFPFFSFLHSIYFFSSCAIMRHTNIRTQIKDRGQKEYFSQFLRSVSNERSINIIGSMPKSWNVGSTNDKCHGE